MATLAPVNLNKFAEEFFNHIHAYAPVKENGVTVYRCVRCDKLECGHDDSKVETRHQPGYHGYFGFDDSFDYEVTICNVCGEESKRLPEADWNSIDELPS